MDVAVLAVDGCFDSGLSAVVDILGTANALRGHLDSPGPPFAVSFVGLADTVRTGNGLLVHTTPLDRLDTRIELLVMPALGVKTPAEIVDTVREHPSLDLIRSVRSAGAELAGACTGTFFLAEAGVLDGLAATTSWWLGPQFRSRYPAVHLDETRTLAREDRITTAGAAFAHIDLALALVQQHSPALADLTARYLLIGDRPSQAAFAMPALLARDDPTMAAFESWVRPRLSSSIRIAAAAQAIGVSERTLQRATAAMLGMSPLEFVHELRLDEATFLLRNSALSADAVALAVGYRDANALRAVVRRRRHSTVAALRQGRSALSPAQPN
jgi:transcriptional regulator GlxA family with amidase domain